MRWANLVAAMMPLFLGCGQSHQPTARQTAIAPVQTGPVGKGAMPADAVHAGLAKGPHPPVGQASGEKANVFPPAKSGDDAGPTTQGAASSPEAPRTASTEVQRGGRDVQIGSVRLTAPEGWIRKKPQIAFILAEFGLPRVEGDAEDAQLTVTAVGENTPKNLDRLREQLGNKPSQGSVEQLRIEGIEVMLVDTSLDPADSHGPFAPPRGGGRYRVLNAIAPIGSKLYFIHCSGPEKTVGARAGEFRAFLQTMKSIGSP
ncbi:MAG: hypothetical protein NUV77_21975 [Thermoguttaceae bacterium]|jgi:hypothetical protein|nr:hypothetical protein [Thermoguttaceae bacterium]